MKVAALILGLLGSLAAVGLGSKWVTDYNKYESTIASMQELSEQMGSGVLADSLGEVKKLKNAGYALVGLGILAFLASVLVFKLGKLSGIIMWATAIVPAIFVPKSLVFTSLLLVAGLLALLAKSKTSAA